MTARSVLLVTHRWLGLSSSVVLSIVATSGSLLLLPDSFLARRIAGAVHDSLAMGWVGWRVVVAASYVAALLQIGGLALWFKKKTLRVRIDGGPARMARDLHFSVGVICLPIMFVLATTGIGRANRWGGGDSAGRSQIRELISRLHTAEDFPWPIKALYMVGSSAFLIQSASGIVMWWTSGRGDSRRSTSELTNVVPSRTKPLLKSSSFTAWRQR
jgi:uncharacterized iron-regulated membrane protein